MTIFVLTAVKFDYKLLIEVNILYIVRLIILYNPLDTSPVGTGTPLKQHNNENELIAIHKMNDIAAALVHSLSR